MTPQPTHITDPQDLQQALAIAATTFAICLPLSFYMKSLQLAAPKYNAEFAARTVSLLHASISMFGGLYAILEHDGGWFEVVGTTRIEANWTAFSFGYFLCDTVTMMLFEGAYSHFFMVHHIITMSSTAMPAFLGKYGFSLCIGLFFMESANPSIHARWLAYYYRDRKNHKTALIRFLTYSWFVLYFVARIALGPWLLYNISIVMEPLFVWAPMYFLLALSSWKQFFSALHAERSGEWWIDGEI